MTESTETRRILSLGTLPVVCAVLVALNGLYLLLVAFGNITDFATNQAFVHHVLSMDTTNFATKPGVGLDPHTIWRAITEPWLQGVLYVILIAWELTAGIVLAIATVLWFRGRRTGYRTARRLSTIGLLMLILLFFGGFTDIGGEWFQMWTSTLWNGEDPAFRNSVLAVLALIAIHLPNEHWKSETRVTGPRDQSVAGDS